MRCLKLWFVLVLVLVLGVVLYCFTRSRIEFTDYSEATLKVDELALSRHINSRIDKSGGNFSSDHAQTLPANGEDRARQVWEYCEQKGGAVPCTYYPMRRVDKRMLLAHGEKFAVSVMGKTGSSNWRTLLLLLRGVITEEEAGEMVYPHSQEYWDGPTDTVFRIKKDKNHELLKEVEDNYYKILIVRDPISRLLSAYRDKFTGTSTIRQFRIYRKQRARGICDGLTSVFSTRPDGDNVPEEIYNYLNEQLTENCNGGRHQTVTLGMFFLMLLFTPEGWVQQDLIVNTHFIDMLTLGEACGIRYNFIGTVETMNSDFQFLKDRLNIQYEMPHIHSTQEGVASKADINIMMDNLPVILKQYIYLKTKPDAEIFGYSGYEDTLDNTVLPFHNEYRTPCEFDTFNIT